MRLVDDLYAYLWPGLTEAEMRRYGNNSNSYVIAGVLPGGRHVIIDPGQVTNEAEQPCLDILESQMEADGLKMENVGLIVSTHGHPDHYGAAQAINARSPALVAMGKSEHEAMQRAWSQMFPPGARGGPQQLEADFYLQEGELDLGGRVHLNILLAPGHSPGHLVIYWPEHKVLICGDLVFYGSTGRVDLPGGSASLLKDSIERIAKLDIEYLLTGHQYGGPGVIQGTEKIQHNFEHIRRNVFPYL